MPFDEHVREEAPEVDGGQAAADRPWELRLRDELVAAAERRLAGRTCHRTG